MKYVLIEVIEREISTPEFFDTFEEAHAKMEQYYNEAAQCDDDDFNIEDTNGELGKWDAWCENANHDNCDWRIYKI